MENEERSGEEHLDLAKMIGILQKLGSLQKLDLTHLQA